MMERLDQDMEMEIFSGLRNEETSGNPVVPVQHRLEDSFSFRCHRGVSCWNRCCHGADVTLTPQCILRLSRRLNVRPRDFLTQYTVPALWERAELPVAKLKMGGEDGKGPCSFVTAEGCAVYEDRPATCRYYPLGLATVKLKDAKHKEDFHFLVREGHCRGHGECHVQTVATFRQEQGIEPYDRVNRGWMDIIMKVVSWNVLGGPYGKEMAPQTKKMFFMVSTDVDALRAFVFGTKFLETYEVAPEAVETLKTDDEALLQLGFDWLKSVLFNEKTIVIKQHVLQTAIAKTREGTGAS